MNISQKEILKRLFVRTLCYNYWSYTKEQNMTTPEIVFGVFLILGALLAYGKVKLEKDESKGFCKLK